MDGMRAVATLALTILAAGCSPTSAQQPRAQAPTDVVGSVGSTSITLAQVDEKALQMPAGDFGAVTLSQALHEARQAALGALIDGLLVDQDAAARGIPRAALVEQEITAKVVPPSNVEVVEWYRANQDRLRGATIDQVQPQITEYLKRERTEALRRQYLDRLRTKAVIRLMLEPPRQVVASAGRPSKGPANAPIELIEFSDFQCPFCLQANSTVQRILSDYGDRIRFVYRHLPLKNHPHAWPSAEAAQCADEQGKFWQYHDRLFADQTKLGGEDLKAHAAALGLDEARFNACVDSHKYKAAVDTDVLDAEKLGVSGTPAFFVNGRLLSGALPYDTFKKVIDEELALTKR